ncbi:MAG: homoserine O-acetyltransferase [Xanthomonadales bacterium]|jgi:homoserine O-acetyltransferase|nr:homoserine O-acetyltransferase [Xanthomonadales bacterium]
MGEFVPKGTRWFDLPSPFLMKRGGCLNAAQLAYESWGSLNLARDNAVLIVTGLSPSAHAASHEANPEPGWWEAMLGPGKAIDTDRWFVICVNSLGSCRGSAGPASINPETGALYGLSFPELSIEDGARAAHALVRGLGIVQLDTLIGCSMGGMTALAYLLQFPGTARRHINICGAAHALPFSIAVRSLQREAIRLDPLWNEGEYTDERYPESGMRIARKLGVLTYRSALEWHGRFGRVRMDNELREDEPFGLEFQVESYLEGHAKRFVRAFDPNCYLYLSRSMDWFDTAEYGEGSVERGLSRIHGTQSLVIGISTDILFPVEQQEQIAEGLALGNNKVAFLAFPSPQGHDAFLVDFDRFDPAVRRFLAGEGLPASDPLD